MAKQANRVTKTRGIPGRPFPERDVVPEDGRHDGYDHDIRRASEGRAHAAEGRCDGRERAGDIMLLSGAGLQDFRWLQPMEMNRMVRGGGCWGAMADKTPAPKVKMRTIRTGVAPDEGQVEAPVGIALPIRFTFLARAR